ncbi:hypothetical protein DACRYDRAFT_49857 [Dacryopinax primogenitus]|uniref:CDP-alcohol phosphatidyltransferase n=1 Tax=Dacryopinax primogenitus (strain DJM 731) TaxID=1858805 RepID=M5GF10_DACPD|nr:uncharacterized protein DACRYDRAFT_49857 [Dacryopinax primogenitus]EJU03733.1 hypothetical protein DACRYDRAFT_49857 [Dacryopinax primogenitus]
MLAGRHISITQKAVALLSLPPLALVRRPYWPRAVRQPGLAHLHTSHTLRYLPPPPKTPPEEKPSSDVSSPTSPADPPTQHENIYTLPNLLTTSRILACPVLGYAILQGSWPLATGLLLYASVTDWLDGWIARKWEMKSVLGTILDPAADKALMTTLTVTLAMKGLLPVPLAVIIIGRDVFLGISAFWWRYTSLPPPKIFTRYWDFSIPSAEVQPTEISKMNTALQLLLMGVTTISPLISYDLSAPLRVLQWIVAGTTIWSGLGYLFNNQSVRLVAKLPKKP